MGDRRSLRRAPRRRGTSLRAVAAATLGLILLGACGGGGSKIGPIHGLLTVPRYTAADYLNNLKGCVPDDGYDDVHAGAGVTVRDASGKIVATSSLDAGVLNSSGACEFGFVVDKFKASKFITIEVSHRGQVTYQVDDLRRDGWNVEMSVG